MDGTLECHSATPDIRVRCDDQTSPQATLRRWPLRAAFVGTWLRDEEAARSTLLSYQAAKARRICGAAPKCSNQTDLHLTFIDPIRPAGLRQRPSLTSMPLATDQKAGFETSARPRA